MRLLKYRMKGCMSDLLCWLTLHAEHGVKQRLEKHGSDSLLIPFQWLQSLRSHQSKMIWLKTHLLHALEWLSIRIQLPKVNPLRNHLLRFTFFPQWVFRLICLYNILKIKIIPFFLANFMQKFIVRNSRLYLCFELARIFMVLMIKLFSRLVWIKNSVLEIGAWK